MLPKNVVALQSGNGYIKVLDAGLLTACNLQTLKQVDASPHLGPQQIVSRHDPMTT